MQTGPQDFQMFLIQGQRVGWFANATYVTLSPNR